MASFTWWVQIVSGIASIVFILSALSTLISTRFRGWIMRKLGYYDIQSSLEEIRQELRRIREDLNAVRKGLIILSEAHNQDTPVKTNRFRDVVYSGNISDMTEDVLVDDGDFTRGGGAEAGEDD